MDSFNPTIVDSTVAAAATTTAAVPSTYQQADQLLFNLNYPTHMQQDFNAPIIYGPRPSPILIEKLVYIDSNDNNIHKNKDDTNSRNNNDDTNMNNNDSSNINDFNTSDTVSCVRSGDICDFESEFSGSHLLASASTAARLSIAKRLALSDVENARKKLSNSLRLPTYSSARRSDLTQIEHSPKSHSPYRHVDTRSSSMASHYQINQERKPSSSSARRYFNEKYTEYNHENQLFKDTSTKNERKCPNGIHRHVEVTRYPTVDCETTDKREELVSRLNKHQPKNTDYRTYSPRLDFHKPNEQRQRNHDSGARRTHARKTSQHLDSIGDRFKATNQQRLGNRVSPRGRSRRPTVKDDTKREINKHCRGLADAQLQIHDQIDRLLFVLETGVYEKSRSGSPNFDENGLIGSAAPSRREQTPSDREFRVASREVYGVHIQLCELFNTLPSIGTVSMNSTSKNAALMRRLASAHRSVAKVVRRFIQCGFPTRDAVSLNKVLLSLVSRVADATLRISLPVSLRDVRRCYGDLDRISKLLQSTEDSFEEKRDLEEEVGERKRGGNNHARARSTETLRSNEHLNQELTSTDNHCDESANSKMINKSRDSVQISSCSSPSLQQYNEENDESEKRVGSELNDNSSAMRPYHYEKPTVAWELHVNGRQSNVQQSKPLQKVLPDYSIHSSNSTLCESFSEPEMSSSSLIRSPLKSSIQRTKAQHELKENEKLYPTHGEFIRPCNLVEELVTEQPEVQERTLSSGGNLKNVITPFSAHANDILDRLRNTKIKSSSRAGPNLLLGKVADIAESEDGPLLLKVTDEVSQVAANESTEHFVSGQPMLQRVSKMVGAAVTTHQAALTEIIVDDLLADTIRELNCLERTQENFEKYSKGIVDSDRLWQRLCAMEQDENRIRERWHNISYDCLESMKFSDINKLDPTIPRFAVPSDPDPLCVDATGTIRYTKQHQNSIDTVKRHEDIYPRKVALSQEKPVTALNSDVISSIKDNLQRFSIYISECSQNDKCFPSAELVSLVADSLLDDVMSFVANSVENIMNEYAEGILQKEVQT